MEYITGYTFDELTVGQTGSISKTITETDVYLFAGISCDTNKAHLDEEYAKQTFFKKRIAHGLISASLVSGVLGNVMPGQGTIWLSQTLNFVSPVYFGDTVTAVCEVVEKIVDSKQIRIKAVCTKQDGSVVLEGEGIVSPPRKPKK